MASAMTALAVMATMISMRRIVLPIVMLAAVTDCQAQARICQTRGLENLPVLLIQP
jgi:hypothetical protein